MCIHVHCTLAWLVRYKNAPVFERIKLLVSAHLSTVLLAEKNGPRPFLVQTGGEGSTNHDYSDLQFELEYAFIHDHEERPRHNYTYVPGDRLRIKNEFLSWILIVSIVPTEEKYSTSALHKRLMDLSRAGVELVVPILYTRHSTEGALRFDTKMSLSCVYGWQHAADNMPSLAKFRYPRSECSESSKGAMLAVGGPVRGRKANDPDLLGEATHFVARALTGPVQFDYVALHVTAFSAISQDMDACRGHADCMSQRRVQNREHLVRVTSAIEKELHAIGLPPHLYEKISVIPFCRLGAGTAGVEKSIPCNAHVAGGQFHATNFLYTLISSEFRWSASWDLDEYLMPFKNMLTTVRADNLFEARDVNKLGHFWIARLPFDIPSFRAFGFLTEQLRSGGRPQLHPLDDNSDSTCSDLDIHGGKSAVRCNIGSSFKIHASTQLDPGFPLDQAFVGRRMKMLDPVLAHARIRPDSGASACQLTIDF